MKILSKFWVELYPIKCDLPENQRGAKDVNEVDLLWTSQKDQATSRKVALGGSVDGDSKPVRSLP
jgi:hypothetical protein